MAGVNLDPGFTAGWTSKTEDSFFGLDSEEVEAQSVIHHVHLVGVQPTGHLIVRGASEE
jgi:hypothetical protein